MNTPTKRAESHLMNILVRFSCAAALAVMSACHLRPTSPVLDTDQDGLSDAQEINKGTNPMKFSSGDNEVSDGWWIKNRLNPFSPLTQDTDGDGRTDASEFLDGTNPRFPDNPPNPTAAAPAAATLVTVATLGPGRYEVTWQNNASLLLGNIVQRSDNGGDTWTTVGVVAPDVTRFIYATASSDTAYFYRVVAYN